MLLQLILVVMMRLGGTTHPRDTVVTVRPMLYGRSQPLLDQEAILVNGAASTVEKAKGCLLLLPPTNR